VADDPLVVDTEPSMKDVRLLQRSLYKYNAQRTGFHDGKSLAMFVRDGSGAIIAGLYGWTWAGCLKISDLWVRESERRRGRGSDLLEAAENEARARSCRRAVLDTYSFQAPGFYEKRGYRIVGVIADSLRSSHVHALQGSLIQGAPSERVGRPRDLSKNYLVSCSLRRGPWPAGSQRRAR
jgi:GNAT superfamily N-acetyltransferase